MASSTPHTILLETNDGAHRPIQEAVAAVALTPGELLAFNAGENLIPHGNAGQNAQKLFAVEDPYVDPRTTTNPAIDVDYAANSRARYLHAQPGDVIYAFLAAGQNVAKGAPLQSDGAGALQAHTPQAVDEGGTGTYTIYLHAIVGYAEEAVDNSGGGTRVRIRLRVA